jgi:dolichyl-phosphate-mannose--protein O-mannosyl transferase
MSRLLSVAKQLVELYLIIVGALVALIANMASADKGNLGENWTMLIVAGLILAAGVGVKIYRWWGLLLAAVMGTLTIGGAPWSKAK